MSEEAARGFFKRLPRQAFKHEEELASNMPVSAALIWTSAEQLRLGRILHKRDGDLNRKKFMRSHVLGHVV